MRKVGIVGLGIMGSAYAKNLLDADVAVEGGDPSESARCRLEDMGGAAHGAAGRWLADCELVILALLSPAALREVAGILSKVLRPGQVVLETGTFSLADKFGARDTLAKANVHLLDCPVSGTGAQAAAGDLVMMASGASDAIERAKPYMALFTKKVIEAGEFGSGSRLKYVANHAVAIHNTVAAETLAYADALGLDRQLVYDMLTSGAGQSKMSDLRMPLMMSGKYEPPTASLKMFAKDISVIAENISGLGLTLPLFNSCAGLYEMASTSLPENHDAAAVFEVYRAKS
ncbi:MAG: NAD(P)-dependent oxidoreductase [Albidovulum sp.]|nr:NAD(P)-dependent oxidoreductase [Albidovulum sp.]MDE0532492.1 NAD(P)-dependent oxidoreductase [Albidovulum sp.]